MDRWTLNAIFGRLISRVRRGVASQLLRGPAGFSDEARQLNQQAAGYADRIVLLHESINELVEKLLSTRGGDGDHLVSQVSRKVIENVEMSLPTTSSDTPASLAAFRSATGVVWGVFSDRRDSLAAD